MAEYVRTIALSWRLPFQVEGRDVVLTHIDVRDEYMRVKYLLVPGFREEDFGQRFVRWKLLVEDDLGIRYQDLGGGIAPARVESDAEREFHPSLVSGASWLRLTATDSDGASESSIQVDLSMQAASITGSLRPARRPGRGLSR